MKQIKPYLLTAGCAALFLVLLSAVPNVTFAQGSPQNPAPGVSSPVPLSSPSMGPQSTQQPDIVTRFSPSPEKTPSADIFAYRPGGMPVTVNGKLLFHIFASTPNLPLKRRALLISRELEGIINDPAIDPEKLTAINNEKAKTCELFYDNRYLFSIYPADIPVPDISPLIAGQRAISIIKFARFEATKDRVALHRQQGVIYGLQGFGVLLAVTIFIVLITRVLRRLLQSWRGKKIRALKAGNVELISEDHFMRAVFFIYRLFLLVLYIVFITLYLDRLLGYFQETLSIRSRLLAMPVTELNRLGLAFISYLPNLIFIIICVFVTKFALGIADKVFEGIEKGHLKTSDFYFEFREIFRKITRFIIYFFALVLILPNVPGYDSPIFKGLSLAAAVMVSLGSSGFVANQLAGISLIASRAYKKGDWVEIGDTMGVVTEVALAFTRIRTNRNIDVVMSNSQILQKVVQNFSSAIAERGGMAISTSISIGYEIHGDIVRDLCMKAAAATDNIVSEPAPIVHQRSLDDSYVSYEIFAFTDNPHPYLITLSALNANIREIFDRAGVEILSPHYKAYRDGSKTTIINRDSPSY
jgi:small-conductance mechanosensitive channel